MYIVVYSPEQDLNLYLSYFDQSVISRKDVKNYFRYCDDIVIVAENKEAIKHIYAYIELS